MRFFWNSINLLLVGLGPCHVNLFFSYWEQIFCQRSTLLHYHTQFGGRFFMEFFCPNLAPSKLGIRLCWDFTKLWQISMNWISVVSKYDSIYFYERWIYQVTLTNFSVTQKSFNLAIIMVTQILILAWECHEKSHLQQIHDNLTDDNV